MMKWLLRWVSIGLNLGTTGFNIAFGYVRLESGHIPWNWAIAPFTLGIAIASWHFTKPKKEVDMCPHGVSSGAANCPWCNPYPGNLGSMSPGYASGGNANPGLMSTGQLMQMAQQGYASLTIKPAPKWTGSVEPRTEPITGWRGYTIGPEATLVGVRQAWQGKRLEAECIEGQQDELARRDQVKRLLGDDEIYTTWLKKNMANTPATQCVTHLEHASCTCGIWGKALATEIDLQFPVVAHCLAYGSVITDEVGNFRASEVEIDRLYVAKVAPPNPSNPGMPFWFSDYIDWQRIADLLRDRYAVPVELVESREGIGVSLS